jgi:hypothetical protein
MRKALLFTTIFSFLFLLRLDAQTSAGKCWYIDYLIWNENQPQLHIDCGNDDAFNVGDELTLEMWIRAYTFGENRKVMGKIDSEGDVFDNGYVLGFENLNPYAEIWNPTLQRIPYPGSGPIPQDSAFVHIACTYSAPTAKLSDYVNGELIGQIDIFPANPIAANDAIFLIGAAPWGPNSFQFYGALDEVRVWNKARTQEEISEYMYKELKGDEEGLVAYYNFNNASDTVVPDESQNSNTGELRNSDDPSWSWADSYVPVGDEKMYGMTDPVAAWFGKAPELWNYATTTNGLSIITDIGEKVFDKYLVFAHNNLSGTTTDYAPEGAGEDYQRTSREWYLNHGGNFKTDMYFNLQEASGGGSQLPSGGGDSSYVLMYRSSGTEDFTAMAYPNQILGDILVFSGAPIQDVNYAIGYSSAPIPIEPDGLEEQILQTIRTGPNPADGRLIISGGKGISCRIFSLTGNLMKTDSLSSNNETIDISDLAPGMYLIQFKMNGITSTRKIIINR